MIRYLVNPHSSNDNNNNHNIELNDKLKKSLSKDIRHHQDSKTVYIPFRTQRGSALERLYLLGVKAQIRQGIFDDIVASFIPANTEKYDFKVVKTKYITKNMLRIYIKSEVALPQDDPGYAYRFLITKSQNAQQSVLQHRLDFSVKLWQSVELKLNQLPYVTTVVDKTKKYALLTVLEVFKRSHQAKQTEATETELSQSKEKDRANYRESKTLLHLALINKQYRPIDRGGGYLYS